MKFVGDIVGDGQNVSSLMCIIKEKGLEMDGSFGGTDFQTDCREVRTEGFYRE